MKALAIALAFLDFAPLFFLAVGLFFLAQLVDRLEPRCRKMALAGLALAILGELGRVISNIALAVTGEGLPLFATAFLVFGAPGLTLMAAALLRARAVATKGPIPRDPWIVPTLVSWLSLGTAFYFHRDFPEGEWSLVMIALAALSTGAMCLAAATLGWKRQLHMAAGLFALSFLGTCLVIAARFLSQNVWIQLSELLIHTAAQGAFSFAAWRVAAEYHARIGPLAAP